MPAGAIDLLLLAAIGFVIYVAGQWLFRRVYGPCQVRPAATTELGAAHAELADAARYADHALGGLGHQVAPGFDGTRSWRPSVGYHPGGRWPVMGDDRNDRLYGWKDQNGVVTALIIYYAGQGWSLCPAADLPQDRWPPLPVNDDAFGSAVRDQVAAGGIADLTPLVATTQNIVFWVPWAGEAGGVFAARDDLPPHPDGETLPRGRFAHYAVLRSGAVPPPLSDLLADSRRVDLGPRFASVPAGGGR